MKGGKRFSWGGDRGVDDGREALFLGGDVTSTGVVLTYFGE